MPARFSTRVTTYSCDRHGPIKTRDCYAVPSQKPGLCHTSADGLANETLCVTLTKGIFFIVQTETIVTSDDSTFFFVVTFKKHSQITRVTSDSETPAHITCHFRHRRRFLASNECAAMFVRIFR